ncbi:unnamed protein product [Heterobilharzia americana]|nr:unnamed protein product [Heterobilharzia americana]
MKPSKSRRNVKGFTEPSFMLPTFNDHCCQLSWNTEVPNFSMNMKKTLGGQPQIDTLKEINKKDSKKRKYDVLKSFETNDTRGAGESFRLRLVDLILLGEEANSESSQMQGVAASDIKSVKGVADREKNILRYYYYIYNGINTDHVAPIDEKLMKKIVSAIRPDIEEIANTALLEKLEDEIREDYLFSVKKAIVNFIINDPADKQEALGGFHTTCDENDKECKVSESRKEIDIVPKPWHSSFLSAYRFCQRNLFVTSTCMLQLLDLWHTAFTDLRLIDVKELYSKSTAMELSGFQQICVKHIEAAKERLLKKWLSEIQNIFYQGINVNLFQLMMNQLDWKPIIDVQPH